jgi:hypothetical protein
MTDIFTAVIFDKRSVVPAEAQAFTTLKRAKEWTETTIDEQDEGLKWEEWDEGRFVYGWSTEEDGITEVIASVYGSELKE